MKKKKKHKIFFSDLKKLFKKTVFILANYEDIIPHPYIYEKGFIYPHVDVIYPSNGNMYATIIIIKNRIQNIDDFCITLLHELIHLWLYTKDIYIHDEEFIEKEAERIYSLERKSILKFVKNTFPHIFEQLGGKYAIN